MDENEETGPGWEAIGPNFPRWKGDWGDMTPREIARAIHGEIKPTMSNIEEIREMLMTDLGIDGEAAEKIMAEAPLGGDVKPGTREHEKALREYAYELIERVKYPEPQLPDHPIFDLFEDDEEFLEAFNAVTKLINVYLVWRFDMMGETLFARSLGCPRYEYEAARRLLEDQVELAMNADVRLMKTEPGRAISIRFRNPVVARLQEESEANREAAAAHFGARHNPTIVKEKGKD
jgi:hypothetical protein